MFRAEERPLIEGAELTMSIPFDFEAFLTSIRTSRDEVSLPPTAVAVFLVVWAGITAYLLLWGAS